MRQLVNYMVFCISYPYEQFVGMLIAKTAIAKRLAVQIMNPYMIYRPTKQKSFQRTTKSSQRRGNGDVTVTFVTQFSCSDRKRTVTSRVARTSIERRWQMSLGADEELVERIGSGSDGVKTKHQMFKRFNRSLSS